MVRPRVSQVLSEALSYRLTLLQARAGYGKSTALAALSQGQRPLIWYHITDEDSDPIVFLLHLCYATQISRPDILSLPIPLLEAWDGTGGSPYFENVVHQYLNALVEGLDEPTLLVMDDVHQVTEVAEVALILDRLIGLAPPNLHIILSSRVPVRLPNLSRWQVRGEVFTVDQTAMAFEVAEIEELFAQYYGYELTPDESQALFDATEGWAIALQVVWQSLRSGATTSIHDALARQSIPLESLFNILTHEVFERQPEDVQDFLRISAILLTMTPEACNALRNATDSAEMLAYLRRQDLFIVDLGDGSLRYHHIFHQFLRQQASGENHRRWHKRAAAYYLGNNGMGTAVYHLLQAKDYEKVAELLTIYGAQLLASGRLDTLATSLAALNPDTLRQHPILLTYLGDLARLRSRFQEALGWYQQAESLWRERGQSEGVARALRGQARVYLDTVDPTRASELLQQALRLSDGIADREADARLYELLAENKLNSGKPDEAEQLRFQAQALRHEGPSESQLLYRVLLRTGRIQEARQKLESRAIAERSEPVKTPRAHRETPLLLSLIYAFQGEAEMAYRAAIDGTQRGNELASPYVTAVGHMRQGHALMLLSGEERYKQACMQYEQAIEMSQKLSIPRLRVEANWGLCRAYGYQGDLTKALAYANEGIEIALKAGDEWIASLVRLAMGASLTLATRYESASSWLREAIRGFRECSDLFGETAARLWQCIGWFHKNDETNLFQSFPEVLAICHQSGYDFLITRPTLLGISDERMLMPLLILGRDRDWEAGYPAHLLREVGLPHITLHPGYQLRIYTLGAFQVWRGYQVVPSNGWVREKTRQLFQLLLINRHAPLDREQIYEYLWPGAEKAAAQRNFKVALNTLYHVLEPARIPGSESAYVIREGTVYALRPGADLWLDEDAVMRNIQLAEDVLDEQPGRAIEYLEKAIDLYRGEYLPDARYESWAAAEREHLAVLFLRCADRLCELYLQEKRAEETIVLSQRILAQDNCWERAYRHLMLAYEELGDHGQIARTYHRCVDVLRDELDVAPAPDTEALFKQLTATE